MKVKGNGTHSSWLAVVGKVIVVFLVTFILTNCTQASTPTPVPTYPIELPTSTTVVEPTATVPSPPTATQPPTATPEPSATPTQPPTATPVPALAVQENGFDIWCAPEEYAGTRPSNPDAPDYALKMVTKDVRILVGIPATYCVLTVRFNQPVPVGMLLTFFDGTNPFLKLPLQAVDGKPDEAWTSTTHSYVINPPLWFVDYLLSVTGPDGKELWSHSVRFAKPLPKPCQFGGYPDPVTMWCTPTDPWEIEPWPDVVYPYPRNP